MYIQLLLNKEIKVTSTRDGASFTCMQAYMYSMYVYISGGGGGWGHHEHVNAENLAKRSVFTILHYFVHDFFTAVILNTQCTAFYNRIAQPSNNCQCTQCNEFKARNQMARS